MGDAPSRVVDLVETFEQHIEATDKQIDQLVYTLYGLTEDEIRIVEGQTTQRNHVASPSRGEMNTNPHE